MNPKTGFPLALQPRLTPGSEVAETASGIWRLTVPAGGATYRLAQLDDYHGLRRSRFRWKPPVTMQLRARASAVDIPGTWGFGLWNDPFGMGVSAAERLVRLPALPNTAWFFHASTPNYLTLDDRLPALGWTAGVFSSPLIPPSVLLAGAPGLALLAIPGLARWLRRTARRIVCQDVKVLDVNETDWHVYRLECMPDEVLFWVDDTPVLRTRAVPRGTLALVIWVDNQFMRFTPDGRLGFGTLEALEPAWLEIGDLKLI